MCGGAAEAVSDAGGAEGGGGGRGPGSRICLPRMRGRLHLYGRRAPGGPFWRLCVRGMRVLPLARWAVVSLVGSCLENRTEGNWQSLRQLATREQWVTAA